MSYVDDVKESFVRCMIHGDIVGRFYDIFLESHPDIKSRFANTDFNSQKQSLRQGINLAIMFADDHDIGKKGINRIRNSHSKSGLNIPPDFYPYWKKGFIQAVSEYDQEFSVELKSQWNSILQKTIDYVIAGY